MQALGRRGVVLLLFAAGVLIDGDLAELADGDYLPPGHGGGGGPATDYTAPGLGVGLRGGPPGGGGGTPLRNHIPPSGVPEDEDSRMSSRPSPSYGAPARGSGIQPSPSPSSPPGGYHPPGPAGPGAATRGRARPGMDPNAVAPVRGRERSGGGSPSSSYGAPSKGHPSPSYETPSRNSPSPSYGAPSGGSPSSSYGAPAGGS
ncbi:pro-resilin-like, partial [Frankliniella occidentalis]|uniref:Pro-resilin-like n=1 Tax=Frankliniella occidentalis TaxID=133901 RepID=A0A9C6X405_FRAOC